ncbi:hypothetical protein JXJ21_06075 [candidate division KSB1 bacterium]|nr:hypothetical protein [candidate division KSB1 bacterium]
MLEKLEKSCFLKLHEENGFVVAQLSFQIPNKNVKGAGDALTKSLINDPVDLMLLSGFKPYLKAL